MQTYTHVTIGSYLGVLAFDHHFAAVAAVAIAAALPDTVMMPLYAIDMIRGREPLAEQSHTLLVLKHLSHSIPLWVIVAIIGWYMSPIMFAFGLGGLSHPLVDMCTHGDPKFNAQDSLYFWPLQKRPFNIGRWDYRITPGALWPLKEIEIGVLVGCVLGIVLGLA